jgi:hypothetical protein
MYENYLEAAASEEQLAAMQEISASSQSLTAKAIQHKMQKMKYTVAM